MGSMKSNHGIAARSSARREPRPPTSLWAACWLVYLLLLTSPLYAGIHVQGETLQPNVDLKEFYSKQLPMLRGYGPPDVTMAGKATPHREVFLAKVTALRQKRQLTPDEAANLGGYLLYLKQTNPRQPAFEEAIAAMETLQRSNPRHFALAANLGTAYQLTGKLDAAERCLQMAVDLAPPEWREMERLHLRLVQLRLRETLGRNSQPDLDMLFGRAAAPFRFINDKGQWNYGELAPAEVAKLPQQSPQVATQQVQQLLVWLPDDSRLHWQLAEWALVMQQPVVAGELFRDAVNTFRLSHPSLKAHRAIVIEARHWGSLAEQLFPKQHPAQWLAQTLGNSLGNGASLASLHTVADALPIKKSLGDMFAGGGAGMPGDSEQPPAKPFVMQPWHWILVAIGVILGIFMLYWQLREWVARFRPT
jgi:tetratricopeptide (TPR) repeat protein